MREYEGKDEVVFDCETNGFGATKIWVVSACNTTKGTERSFIKYEKMRDFLTDPSRILIVHNGEAFDKPTLERVLGIKITAKIVDTLGLSWYLYPTRQLHGLASWGEEFGVPKPEITEGEWLGPLENETYEDFIAKMVHRCEEDTKINTLLWEKIKKDLKALYGKEDFWKAVDYICFKMQCAALQEKCKWKLDVPAAQELVSMFEAKIADSKDTLQSVMPKVPVYVSKSRPKKPFKKDGSLSSTGVSWQDLCKEHGFDFDYSGEIKYVKGYEEPNGGSPAQIKNWLFSLGWKPTLYAYKRNKETGDVKKIEQIKNKDTGDLCEDIKRLIKDTPELQVLEDLSVLSHRKSVVEGFLSDVDDKGFIAARIQGFTNTLRFRHKVFLNIPSLRKPYGKEIRGLLIARNEDMELMGADCSSLEDRTGQHFMWKYDPEYVKDMMADDFDPHVDIALEAGLMTADEAAAYKLMDAQDLKDIELNGKAYNKKKLALKRHAGKSCLPKDNTQVLTSEGWKSFEELKIGQSVLSYNTESKATEFCKVTDVLEFNNQDVVMMSNNVWEIESTADHRWLTEHRTGRGRTRRTVVKYATTDELATSHNIVSSGKYVGGGSAVSAAQARLLGWVLADGCFLVAPLSGKTSQGLDGRRQSDRMSLSQHPSKFLDDVISSIEACGISYRKYVNKQSGVYNFTFVQPDAREFLIKLGLPLKSKHEIDYTQFMLGLSKDALENFFEAFWLADGNTGPSGHISKSRIIYQNDGNVLDAIQLCSELLGKTTIKNRRKDTANFHTLRCKDSYVVGMQRMEKTFSRNVDVFCLTTENGNFFIRQGGVMTITGNCNYSSKYGAGAPTIARAAGVAESVGHTLHKAYWSRNWSLKKIAEECIVKQCLGVKWLWNPVAEMWYWLKTDKDKFSTLNQGTGTYCFDMWIKEVLKKRKQLTGQAHDEGIWEVKKGHREAATKLLKDAIQAVNKNLKLNRDLDVGVQFGASYAEIH